MSDEADDILTSLKLTTTERTSYTNVKERCDNQPYATVSNTFS